jgi:acyl carrier protein
MTRNEIMFELSELLETDTPLNGSEVLSGLGEWDSLAVLSLMAMVDDKWGVTLAPKDIYTCTTVDDLVALVR